jgi:spore germination protein
MIRQNHIPRFFKKYSHRFLGVLFCLFLVGNLSAQITPNDDYIYEILTGDENKKELRDFKKYIEANKIKLDDKIESSILGGDGNLDDKLDLLLEESKNSEDLRKALESYVAERDSVNQQLNKILTSKDQKRFLEGFSQYLKAQKESIGDNGKDSAMDELGYRGILKKQFDDYVYYKDSSVYNNNGSLGLDQNITVFGWHPYWLGNTHQSYNFDLLSIVSYFSYDLNPKTGESKNSYALDKWMESDLVETAHEKNTKVLLTVSNHGGSNNSIFLSSNSVKSKKGNTEEDISTQERQQTLIDSLLFYVEKKGADGVDINFENIPAKYKLEFTHFVKNISTQFKAKNKDYIIVLTVEPKVSKAYDIPELVEYVNLVVIMGYETHNASTSSKNGAGPLSPLYDLKNSVEQYVEAGVNKSLLVLALPHYGTVWKGDEFIDYKTYSEIRNEYDGSTLNRDDIDHTVNYTVGDTITVWWDDSVSLKHKYDWIIEEKIGGMGIWALGYDNGYNDIWEAIDEKFTGVKLPSGKMTKSLSLLRTMRKYRNLMVVGCVFLIMFIVLGFTISFWDWRVRQAFFEAKTFRLIYIISGFIILMVLLINAQWLDIRWVVSMIGILLGLLLMGLVVYRINIRRRTMP